MLADLDLLLTAMCSASRTISFLQGEKNARMRPTDAEVVTLCVAQAVMGISSDREFLAVARARIASKAPRARRRGLGQHPARVAEQSFARFTA